MSFQCLTDTWKECIFIKADIDCFKPPHTHVRFNWGLLKDRLTFSFKGRNNLWIRIASFIFMQSVLLVSSAEFYN